MKRRVRMMSFALIFPIIAGVAQQPSVHLQQPNLQGSRPLETQTQASVVRDYLESWKGLQAALDKNQAALLDSNFVGTARDKLANTIDEQMKAGIHTRYQARCNSCFTRRMGRRSNLLIRLIMTNRSSITTRSWRRSQCMKGT
jgi:hypothetical protein